MNLLERITVLYHIMIYTTNVTHDSTTLIILVIKMKISLLHTKKYGSLLICWSIKLKFSIIEGYHSHHAKGHLPSFTNKKKETKTENNINQITL